MLETPKRTHKLELELKRPGLLRDVLQTEEKIGQPQFDDLIVFGNGPVLDMLTREKPTDQTSETGINLWGEMSAIAAAELKTAGVIKRIIITGGRTGGDAHPSEAELMRDVILKKYPGILSTDIVIEPKATNTLENFAYTINALDQEAEANPNTKRKTAFLGADFHTLRIGQLARLYGFSEPVSFSAQAIFRVIAERTNDNELHAQLDKLLSTNDDLSPENSRIDWQKFFTMPSEAREGLSAKSAMKAPTFFEEFLGSSEQLGIVERKEEDMKWSRGLDQLPKYWIGYLGYLTNDQRLQRLLNRIGEKTLSSLGIDIAAPLSDTRTKLLEYTKPGIRELPPKEWEIA